MNKSILSGLTLCFALVSNLSHAAELTDPCIGPSSLLNLIDRPTQADSACVVKSGDLLLELGFNYEWLHEGGGHANTFPQAEIRIGLPCDNEFVLVPPNYIKLDDNHSGAGSGFTAGAFGLKHEFGYTDKWIYSAEIITTPPSGSDDLGSDDWGGAFNGIFSYSITSALGLSGMFGISTQTDSTASGGGRYVTFNPDLVLSYQTSTNFQIYGEMYGQTKTSSSESTGFNVDAGIQYLMTPDFELDLEYGQRLNGDLFGFTSYVGAGLGLHF